jgi:hypothetical protein
VTELSNNGGNLKATLRAIFASEDFVSF